METTKQERYTGTFTERVIAWAKDRNIIGGSTPRDQFLKLVEEVGELVGGLAVGDQTEIKDGIGDTAVVVAVIAGQIDLAISKLGPPLGHLKFDRDILIAISELSSAIQKNESHSTQYHLRMILTLLHHVAAEQSLDFDDCCEHAWNEIKDRRGKLIGGVFVKEAG